jgi:hypothetical protein
VDLHPARPGADHDARASPGIRRRHPRAPLRQGPITNAINVSEGDQTHRANLARTTFGVSGAGVKVGVLSSGVISLATLQGSGDLPAVTVLPGQAGTGDEGSAMLEIVHDLAPNAQLYFATANGGVATFANNIKALRNAGCDVIIDDVSYFTETPFHEGQLPNVVSPRNGALIQQAVNDVTADGALYFSSAANSGNQDDGQSGTWEGDFADGGAVTGVVGSAEGQGIMHDFDPSAAVSSFDSIRGSGGTNASLFWSDPLGAATNDYDIFVLNSSGTGIIASSSNVQDGTQDPIEIAPGSIPLGARIVVVKFLGSRAFCTWRLTVADWPSVPLVKPTGTRRRSAHTPSAWPPRRPRMPLMPAAHPGRTPSLQQQQPGRAF